MKRTTTPSRRAFSLIEVVTALSIISVGVIPLLAMLPLGLANSRANTDKTRGAQMARMILSTLTSETFNSARALEAPEGPGPLDLSVSHDKTPVLFFASYDPRQEPTVVRAETPPASMGSGLELYRLELLVQRQTVPGDANGRVAGSVVTVTVFRPQDLHRPVYTTQSYIANLHSVGTLSTQPAS